MKRQRGGSAANSKRPLKRQNATVGVIFAQPRGLPATLRSRIPEVKTVDIPQTSTLLSTTATFQLLNGIQEGSSFFNRVGRKVMMKSFRLTGSIIPDGLGAGNAHYIRIMVVYDRQPNGTFPAIADLLQNVDNAGAATTTSLSGMNMNNAERFLMLADLRIDIPQDSGTTDNQFASIIDYKGEFNIDRYIKLRNLETHFKASSNPAVVADQSTGSLFLCTFGNVAAASAEYDLQWTGRLRYHDV